MHTVKATLYDRRAWHKLDTKGRGLAVWLFAPQQPHTIFVSANDIMVTASCNLLTLHYKSWHIVNIMPLALRAGAFPRKLAQRSLH